MSDSDQPVDRLRRLMIRLYNAGYKAGHHYTVEGGYVDVFDCDREEYHEDVVEEIVQEWESEHAG